MNVLNAPESGLDPRLGELADFLRRRRATLSPEALGLPTSGRRRTPGLRREEVAELAGISAGLYTWLEQGRDVPISRRTADAIATALQLDRAERTHLHYLTSREHAELEENPSPALQRLVFSMLSHPTFVLDHTWDILLVNHAGFAIFGEESADASTPLNLLEETYLKPRFRTLFPDWECVVSHLCELFRYDYAAYASDPKTNDLVARLQAASPVFKANWEQHRIRPFPGSVREVDHPVAGHLSLEPTTYSVVESPGLRLLMYTPTDQRTYDRIIALVAKYEREGRLPRDDSPAGYVHAACVDHGAGTAMMELD